MVGVGRFGGDFDDLPDRPALAITVPDPDRRREIFEADDTVDEAMGLRRIVRRTQLEDELVLLAEIDLLHMLALGVVPEMQAVAVSATQQDFRNQAILERVGRAPLARHHRVVPEMPPGVIAKLLRPAIDLPTTERLEAFVVHHEHPSRALAFG